MLASSSDSSDLDRDNLCFKLLTPLLFASCLPLTSRLSLLTLLPLSLFSCLSFSFSFPLTLSLSLSFSFLSFSLFIISFFSSFFFSSLGENFISLLFSCFILTFSFSQLSLLLLFSPLFDDLISFRIGIFSISLLLWVRGSFSGILLSPSLSFEFNFKFVIVFIFSFPSSLTSFESLFSLSSIVADIMDSDEDFRPFAVNWRSALARTHTSAMSGLSSDLVAIIEYANILNSWEYFSGNGW